MEPQARSSGSKSSNVKSFGLNSRSFEMATVMEPHQTLNVWSASGQAEASNEVAAKWSGRRASSL